jgi:hypothetical protein
VNAGAELAETMVVVTACHSDGITVVGHGIV